jgi:hypothetical protein
VELVGLELPSMRLCEISDEMLFGSSSVREPQHLLLTRPCDRCIEEAGDADSARKPTIDSRFDEAWREEASDIVMLTWRLLHASRAAMASIVAVPVSISDSHCRPRAIALTSLSRLSERIGRASASALFSHK